MKRPGPDRLERRLILALAVTAGFLFLVLLYLNHRDAVRVEVVPPPQAEVLS